MRKIFRPHAFAVSLSPRSDVANPRHWQQRFGDVSSGYAPDVNVTSKSVGDTAGRCHEISGCKMEPKLKLEKAVSSSTSSRYHVASGRPRTRVAKWTTRNERWVPRCNRLEGGSLQRCCPPRGSCGHGTRVMMTRWERSDESYLSRGYISMSRWWSCRGTKRAQLLRGARKVDGGNGLMG